ncbi:hypothetical protein [Paraburkholderia bannensis]|uniref:hypothetical protein n=1 Tax=Paraburkholderia bannensis TaxID=765414 RepID=UPI002AB7A2AA|nr:hypothetical protein [Paraburkholderia bannensis]
MGNFSNAGQYRDGFNAATSMLNVPSSMAKCAISRGKREFRAEFALSIRAEGRTSAASNDLYDPLPLIPFGRKAMTGKAFRAFAALKANHRIQTHAHPDALVMAHSAIDDGTFGLWHSQLGRV